MLLTLPFSMLNDLKITTVNHLQETKIDLRIFIYVHAIYPSGLFVSGPFREMSSATSKVKFYTYYLCPLCTYLL